MINQLTYGKIRTEEPHHISSTASSKSKVLVADSPGEKIELTSNTVRTKELHDISSTASSKSKKKIART